MKRLLNLHTIQKITLILTTLLLLPMSSSAGTFSTQGNTITSNGSQYSWGYGGGLWTITTTNATLSSPLSNSLTTSESGFKSGGYIKLSTTRPIDTDTKLRIIRIQGSCDGCTFSFRFQKKDGTFTEEYQIERNESEYLYAFGEPLEWGEGKSLEITISSNNDNASCSISNIIFHTKDCSDVTYEWPNTPTSEYDISGIQRRTGTDEVIFEGHCMNKTVFSFALEPQTTVTNPKITYTSSNTQVAVVDEQTGKVTVNGSGSTTITATPVETDDVYYNPASYSYTLNITSLDDNLGLIVGGITVNSTNKGNITGDGSISYDEDNKTLTLNNATLTSSIISYLDKLTIDIQGNNTITTNGEPAIKTPLSDSYRDLIIESTSTPLGSLILKNTKSGENCGGVVSEKFSIALQGSVKLLAPYYGDGCIKMDSTHVASFGESYNLAIDMVRVGNTNATDIFWNHKASYDKDKHTLTLNGISINNNIERTSAEDLTIALNGENSITVSSGAAISGAVAAGVDIQPTLSFVLADGASNAKLTMTNGANDVSSVSGFTWYESDSGFYVLREYGETTKKTIITSTIFSGGNGTKDNPFIISSLQDFKDFVHYMNDRDGVNPPICMAYFKLEGDIDCSEFTDFTPINGGDQPFMGSFDGNGKTISNITYTTPYTSANVGLFNSIGSGGVVKNLTLNNCSFTGGVCTGSIASYLEGSISNCTINNCTISTGNAQSPDAGGVAGYIYGGSIENCKVSGSTINAQPTGDAGWISGNNGVATAGGIGGKLIPSGTSGTITSCEVSNSNINASHPNSIDALGAGGIVADCSQGGTISNNIVKGTTKISSKSLTEENKNNACAGAIVGKKGSATFTNNTYEFSVTTEEAETSTQSEPTIKSRYIHRGIGEKIYNETSQAYVNSSDIFGNNGIVLANIKKVTLTQNSNAEGEIWIKESYQRDLGEGTFEEYIVTGQEAVIGASMSEPYAIASFIVTTSGSETISTSLDNEAIGDEVPAYVFTMPNDDVTVSAIFGIDIANANISLDNNQTEFIYTGGKISPIITNMVIAEETENPEITPSYQYTLTSNDYTVSYKTINETTETDISTDDIVNVGSYKMILTGKGDYFGTKEIPFTITPRPIETPIITLSATEFVFNSQAQKPTVTVQFKESADVTKTIPTTDYDVTYSGDCINVDSYTVNVTLKGNYTGEADATFSITAGTMTVTAAGYEGTYDNQAHGITVTAPEGATVKYGSQKGTYNLTESPKYTDAGTYKVHYQVTMDNYTNVTDSAMVEISKADITPEVTLEGWTYGTTANLPSVTGNSGNGAVTYTYKAEGSETFVETMPEVVGTHTIKASIAETTNYNAGEATSTYTITAATTSVTAKGYKGAYDNQPHGVSITAPEGATVKYGTEKGTYNLDESPTYTDAGTYMVHYQVTMDNYTTVTDSATIEISKADITPTVTLEGWIFGTTANTPSVTGNTGNGAVTYTYKAEGTDTFVEAMPEVVGTHTIKASIAETTNYNAGEATATFTITASTMTVTANGYEGTYDGKAHGITVTAPEGATVMYGTQKDTYNLTESPTYTNAGTYKVHYQVTMDNHTTVADSATVKISKAEAELEFEVPEEGKVYATIGKEFTEPTLSNLHELSVTYGSSDESVATVDETTGKVTLISAGLTYITATFAGNNNYNELEVKYELRVKGTYNLWINNVQVTSDNYNDILENQKFFYDLVNKWLIITDNETPVTVKSSMPELTIYLNGKSELERIYFDNQGNAQNTGTLSFITYSDLPGKLILDTNNDNGVISGFSSISFDENTNLRIIEPDSCEYKDGLVKMTRKDQLGDIVKIATIGQYIEPMVNGDGIDFDKDIDGNTNITNITIDDKLLITAMQHEEDTNEDDDYYDPSSGAIVLNTTNTSEDVEVLSQEVESGNKTPGSGDYADSFRGGITFMVPSGKGTIELEVMTGEGYMLMLKIGTGEPHEIIENERATVTIEYDVEESTYVYLYLQEKPVMKARWAGNTTRVGKRDTAHGRIYAVKVKASVVKSSNPLNSVEGAKGNVTIPTVNTVSPSNDDDVPTKAEFEITNDENNVNDDKWFTIDGRRIDKPTQKGLYIRNRKKIVVK